MNDYREPTRRLADSPTRRVRRSTRRVARLRFDESGPDAERTPRRVDDDRSRLGLGRRGGAEDEPQSANGGATMNDVKRITSATPQETSGILQECIQYHEQELEKAVVVREKFKLCVEEADARIQRIKRQIAELVERRTALKLAVERYREFKTSKGERR